MKLNNVQKHQLRTSHDNASIVLRQVKAKPLTGAKLEWMQDLETAVQHLEACLNSMK